MANTTGCSISRREFLAAVSAAAAAGAIGERQLNAEAGPTAAATPRPKNVLFIMTDEHNIRHLSANGHTHALTPNIDRLMNEGVYFENAVCAYPVCTASRGSLHTGTWSHIHNQQLNCNEGLAKPGGKPGDLRCGLTGDTRLLATGFHEKAFACYHVGKWHLGDTRRHACYNWHPRYESDAAYTEHLARWTKEHPIPADLPPGSWKGPQKWPVYGMPGMEKFTATGLPYATGRDGLPIAQDYSLYYTDLALDDLKTCGNRPFIFTWSDRGPHGPHIIADPYYSAVDPKALPLPTNLFRPDYCAHDPSCRSYDTLMDLMGETGIREYQRCYCAMIRKIDDQIGRLLKELERRGDLDDTLIIFTADHGDMGGSHRTAGGKAIWEFYEEIVRVPLALRWPRGIQGGRRIKTHAEGVDLMPTILDYMGLPIPAQCQGKSLRQYIDGREDLSRPAFCESDNPESKVARKMIRTHEFALWFYCTGKPGQVFREARPMALYDLEKDPGQESNLATEAKYAAERKKLIQRIMGWMEETRDPLLKSMPFTMG